MTAQPDRLEVGKGHGGVPSSGNPQAALDDEVSVCLALLVGNPSFEFLEDEPDLYE